MLSEDLFAGVCMRHWLKFLVLTMIIAWCGTWVQATTFSTSISGSDTIEIGSEITLTFAFDVDASISQMTAKLNFDSDLLDVVSPFETLNGLEVTVSESNEITVKSSSGVSGAVSFMRVTFRAKDGFDLDSVTTVSISDVSGVLVESMESVSGSGSSRQITVVAPKSANNYLSDLYTNAGDIGFSRNTFEYSLIVENEVSRIRVVAKAEDVNAQVKEDVTYNLAVYNNVFNIVVTAQNGEKRTYKITVIRKDALGNVALLSSNAELKSLAVEGYPFDFSPSIVEYRMTVGNIVDNVLVYAVASDPKSSVIIDNVPLLQLGENRIQITVVALSGQSRIYTLFVTRSLQAPVSKLEDLGNIVYLTTASVLPVIIEDSYWLSVEVLDKVRRAAKTLDIQKLDNQGRLLYRWTIDGRSLSSGMSIHTGISTDSDHRAKLTELLNSSRFKTIRLLHQGNLPIGTIVRVYIGELFEDLTSLNLYRYDVDNQRLDPNSQMLRVDEGYVEFEVLLAGEYVVSDVEIEVEPPLDLVLLIALAVIAIIIIILGWLLFSRRSQKSYGSH
jgi:hypothetical protein